MDLTKAELEAAVFLISKGALRVTKNGRRLQPVKSA